MYKILLIAILSIFVNAQNPKPYSQLSDPIYNHISYIKKLKNMDIYDTYAQDLNTYINDVTKTKKEGYKLELGTSSMSKKEYLIKIRQLSKKNSYFLNIIDNYYKSVLSSNECSAFLNIIDNGLIDVHKHKNEILDYYNKHSKVMPENKIIEELLDENAKLKIKRRKNKKHNKIRRTKAEEKIRRLREEDKKKEKAFQKKLQNQLEQEKLRIRQEQKKELCS